MKIKLKEFENILNKVSVSNTFDYVQLLVSPTIIKSSLALPSRALITILTLENTFLVDMNESDIFEMNFNTPNMDIIPHLKIFSSNELKCEILKGARNEIATIKVAEKETKMSAKWNLGLACANKIFTSSSFSQDVTYFTEINIDEKFMSIIYSLKKIAYNTNKIYFSTDSEKILSIEVGDKKQQYINSFKVEIGKISDELSSLFNNIAICIDAKIFMSVMDQLPIDDNFKIKIAYKPEKRLGMLCITNDKTETYVIPQIIEID